MEVHRIHAALAALAELRKSPDSLAVAYIVDRITDLDLYPMYECLRRTGPVRRLDLVLFATGGTVDVARGMALLLHEYCAELRILVPDHAESAATLLCLAAHELVLGPMARLGPIDPYLTAGEASGNGPGRISAAEVRALPDVARTWFGVDPATAGAQSFALAGQRLFPSVLGGFLRADRNVRRAGRELIAYHLPNLEPDRRAGIVDQLVDGYDSHGHVITRAEAARLGLAVTHPSSREEELMWACAEPMRGWFTDPDPTGDPPRGLVVSSAGFTARHVLRPATPQQPIPGSFWEIGEAATTGGAAC